MAPARGRRHRLRARRRHLARGGARRGPPPQHPHGVVDLRGARALVSAPRRPLVLGLAASHNGAACLLDGDGEVLAAVQEERLTRVKRAFLRPAAGARAIDEVLDAAGVTAADLDQVVTCPLRSRHAPELDLARHPTLAAVP
ncbi:MAG: hypothetical protein EP329_12255, partial [Deltaproteobacteria bacterium]